MERIYGPYGLQFESELPCARRTIAPGATGGASPTEQLPQRRSLPRRHSQQHRDDRRQNQHRPQRELPRSPATTRRPRSRTTARAASAECSRVRCHAHAEGSTTHRVALIGSWRSQRRLLAPRHFRLGCVSGVRSNVFHRSGISKSLASDDRLIGNPQLIAHDCVASVNLHC